MSFDVTNFDGLFHKTERFVTLFAFGDRCSFDTMALFTRDILFALVSSANAKTGECLDIGKLIHRHADPSASTPLGRVVYSM